VPPGPTELTDTVLNGCPQAKGTATPTAT